MKKLIYIMILFSQIQIVSQSNFNCCSSNFIKNNRLTSLCPVLIQNQIEIDIEKKVILYKPKKESLTDDNIEKFILVNWITKEDLKVYQLKIQSKEYIILKSKLSGATKFNMYLNTYLILDVNSKKSYYLLSFGDINSVFCTMKNKEKVDANIYKFDYSTNFIKREKKPSIKVLIIDFETGIEKQVLNNYEYCRCQL